MYNDFAIINEQDFVKVANEYNKLLKANALNIKNSDKVDNYINETMYQLKRLQNINKNNRHKTNICNIISKFEKIIDKVQINTNKKYNIDNKSQYQKGVFCEIVKDVLLNIFLLCINLDNESLNLCKEDITIIFKDVLELIGYCRYRW